jgi:uncharacterized protein
VDPEIQWWSGLLAIVFASLMLGFILAATLKSVFNFFPIRVIPIGVRRAIGLLAGPSIIVAFVWWVTGQSFADGTPVMSSQLAFGPSHLAVAVVITAWLGWKMAPEGASRVWAGGMKWKDVPGLIFDLFVGMLVSGFSSVVSVGGSGSSGGFSGGGGSSGGGGASGSW